MLDEQCKGFLLTCDQNKEKQAVKDAYNFISEYIEQQYENLEQQTICKKIKGDGKQVNLQTQIKETKKTQNRLLFSVDTNVKCLIFIKINNKFTQIDPNHVVQVMMKDMHQKQRQLTRYCHKILPVEKAFKAQHFAMLDAIRDLVQKRDNSEKKSWALNFKCRNNSKFNYKEVLRETQTILKEYGHFVDIYYPQWTISVEISHHLMCIGIAQKFKEYQQFKLRRKPFQFTPQQKQRFQALKAQKSYKNPANRRYKQQAEYKEKSINKKDQQNGQQQQLKLEDINKQRLLQQEIKQGQDDVDLI